MSNRGLLQMVVVDGLGTSATSSLWQAVDYTIHFMLTKHGVTVTVDDVVAALQSEVKSGRVVVDYDGCTRVLLPRFRRAVGAYIP